MVQVFGLQQGGMRPAGEHRRHTKLRQSFDLPGIGAMGPLIGPSWCILCQDRLAALSFIGEPGKSQPTNEAQENILSFIWINAGAGRIFAGLLAFSPRATSFAIQISPSV